MSEDKGGKRQIMAVRAQQITLRSGRKGLIIDPDALLALYGQLDEAGKGEADALSQSFPEDRNSLDEVLGDLMDMTEFMIRKLSGLVFNPRPVRPELN